MKAPVSLVYRAMAIKERCRAFLLSMKDKPGWLLHGKLGHRRRFQDGQSLHCCCNNSNMLHGLKVVQ